MFPLLVCPVAVFKDAGGSEWLQEARGFSFPSPSSKAVWRGDPADVRSFKAAALEMPISSQRRGEAFLSAFCCCLAQSCHFEGVYSEVFMHLPSGHNGRHFINCQPACLKPLVHIVSFSLINLEEFINSFNAQNNRRSSESISLFLPPFFLVSGCLCVSRPRLSAGARVVSGFKLFLTYF